MALDLGDDPPPRPDIRCGECGMAHNERRGDIGSVCVGEGAAEPGSVLFRKCGHIAKIAR